MVLNPLQRHHVTDGEALAVLAEDGLVLLDGITDSMGLLRLARSIASVVSHRDSDSDGITTIADRGPDYMRAGFIGFTACALDPHTDGSGVAHPPDLLMTSCRQPAPRGGECVVADGQAIYDDLAGSEPEALLAFRTPRSVLFGGATGHLGAIFTDVGDGRVAIRLRLDDLARFSFEVSHWLPALHAAIERHTTTFTLRCGETYILNNQRWLHGRRSFVGERVLYRVTGNSLPHLANAPGFRPMIRSWPG